MLFKKKEKPFYYRSKKLYELRLIYFKGNIKIFKFSKANKYINIDCVVFFYQ